MVSCHNPYKIDCCDRKHKRDHYDCRDKREHYDCRDKIDCCSHRKKKLDCDPCDPRDRKKGKNCIPILECGESADRPLPPVLTQDQRPVPLARVTINTKCLCKPCVKIEYSSIITLMGGNSSDNSIEFVFRLVKRCKKGKMEELQRWAYAHNDVDRGETWRDSFTVTFCECLDCFDEDCCEYIMQLIEVTPSVDGNNEPLVIYRITNRDISAFAACKSPC